MSKAKALKKEGHPLPGSDEARHNEIPEHLEQEKGRGDDSRPVVQPDLAVTPDGEPYRYDDLGRGPETEAQGKKEQDDGGGADPVSATEQDEFASDQIEHQDRGQSAAEAETDES